MEDGAGGAASFLGVERSICGRRWRLRNGDAEEGRAIVMPMSDKTRGHGSHTLAALWKDELVKLLKETGK